MGAHAEPKDSHLHVRLEGCSASSTWNNHAQQQSVAVQLSTRPQTALNQHFFGRRSDAQRHGVRNGGVLHSHRREVWQGPLGQRPEPRQAPRFFASCMFQDWAEFAKERPGCSCSRGLWNSLLVSSDYNMLLMSLRRGDEEG